MADEFSQPEGQEPEAVLLDGAQGGDPQARTRLVRRYAPRMLAVAYRLLGDHMAAEDTVQDAFLSAFRHIDRFEGRSSLGTWLHSITVNAAVMKLRSDKRKCEQTIEGFLSETEQKGFRMAPLWQTERSVEDTIEQQEIQALVMATLNELPEKYRRIFILRHMEELNTREAVALMGISENVVKIRLHRACAALKKRL